jgi:hypothetical protein
MTSRLLQVALHYYQSVCKALWLLLKQAYAGLNGCGDYLIDSARTPQKIPSFAAAMLQSDPAASVNRTENTASDSYFNVGYVNVAAFT